METTEPEVTPSFQQQLMNLQELQEQIERTKQELSQLGKIEQNQDKGLQSIYKQSIETTRNKLNHVDSKQHMDHLHDLEMQQIRLKQEKVREFREKK